MFVTCLYSVRPSYTNELIDKFKVLMNLIPSNIDVYIWTDQDLKEISYPNLHIIHQKLSELKTYNLCMKEGLQLPQERNPSKDTQEYMALMNTKTELLSKTIPLVKSQYLVWIDCGITKIFTDLEYIRNKLAIISNYMKSLNSILIAGIYNKNIVPKNSVYWRFCGGFFMIPVSLIEPFLNIHTKELENMIGNEQRITWEVNVWAQIEHFDSNLFTWYRSDFNNSILNIPT